MINNQVVGNVDVVPAGGNPVARRVVDELPEQCVIGREEPQQLFGRFYVLEFLAVGVHIVKREFVEQSGICHIDII